MGRRLEIVGCSVVLAAAALTGCGGSDGASSGAVTAPDDVGSLGDAVEVAAGAPARADAAACGLELATLETASELYLALIGEPPTSEDDLLAEQLLTEPSELFDIDADGTIVAAPGSPCT